MLTALLSSACSTSREVSSLSTSSRTVEGVELRDSVRVERLIEQDTLKETTTITVQTNDKGDTLSVVQITERDRIRDRANMRDQKVEVKVEHDTVFIATRDSVSSTMFHGSTSSGRASPFVTGVKWLVALVCSIIVLLIIIRFVWRK